MNHVCRCRKTVHIERPAPDDARPYGRRTFLTLLAGGASSLLWCPAAWNLGRAVLLPVAGLLPRPDGAPARVVIPEMYGYKGVKWLNKITLLEQPFDGYWENRGYDRNAWIDHRA